MFREVKNAWFGKRLKLTGWRYHLMQGQTPSQFTWKKAAFLEVKARQEHTPTALYRTNSGRTYWAFQNRFYWDDEGLRSDDVFALVRDRERRQERRVERAKAALAGESAEPVRTPIPREVRLAVWQRDGGRCVGCGSSFDIQYDHIIPFSMGGATTVENLQILCATCNQRKGGTLG